MSFVRRALPQSDAATPPMIAARMVDSLNHCISAASGSRRRSSTSSSVIARQRLQSCPPSARDVILRVECVQVEKVHGSHQVGERAELFVRRLFLKLFSLPLLDQGPPRLPLQRLL